MQVGPLEILVVAAIALIVFGPQKLPEIARTIARFLGELRRVATEVKSEFAAGLDDPVEDERDIPVPEAQNEDGSPVRTTAED